MTAELDAPTIVGLLADDDRRAVVAALTLGACTLGEVVNACGLPVDRAAKAAGRLVDGGLVVTGDDGRLVVLGAAFQLAARRALHRPSSDEHADRPPEVRKVLDAFVDGGRLASIPTTRAKRLVVLDWLVQEFEPGQRYSERQVNAMLARRHPDTASLRRFLVDEELLERADGDYWRIGGALE